MVASGFIESINPLLIGMRLIGLIPCRFRKTKMVIETRDLLSSTLKKLALIVLVVIIAAKEEMLLDSVFSLVQYTKVYGTAIYVITSLVFLHFDRTAFIEILNNLALVDETMIELCKFDCVQMRRFNLVTLGFLLALVMTFIISDVIKFYVFDSHVKYPILRFCLIVIGYSVSFAIYCCFFVILRELRQRYIHLTDTIADMQSGYNSEIMKRVNEIKRKLRAISCKTNAVFEKEINCHFVLNYIYILSSMSYLPIIQKFENELFIMHFTLILWFLICCIEIIGTIYVFDATQHESRKIETAYLHLCINEKSVTYSEISLQIFKFKFERVDFNLMGMFRINLNLLLTISGSIVTNLIMLLQFRQLDRKDLFD